MLAHQCTGTMGLTLLALLGSAAALAPQKAPVSGKMAPAGEGAVGGDRRDFLQTGVSVAAASAALATLPEAATAAPLEIPKWEQVSLPARPPASDRCRCRARGAMRPRIFL